MKQNKVKPKSILYCLLIAALNYLLFMIYLQLQVKIRVSDPYTLYTDPDPDPAFSNFFLDPDPDPKPCIIPLIFFPF